ncbi:hypothetical protein BSKO_11006 [Bryopsis sp. KO-2023]|nr:hypothetical protein BSKO_11006 [Bryopsis sp. KO-2023]
MTAVRFVTLAIVAFICAAAKTSKKDICRREKILPSLISPKPKTAPKIAEGSRAADGRYPYIVSLWQLFGRDDRNENDYRYFCGAALIAPDWVITAASCVDPKRNGVENPAVFGGTIWREGPFPELSFSTKTFLHPGWVSNPFSRAGFDVALLKLPCRSNLPIVKLPPKGFKNKVGDSLWAIGWGRTGPSTPFADRLNEVKLPRTDPRFCSQVLKFRLAKSLICAGRGIGDICQGDTGSPLVSRGESFEKDVLVGVSPELIGNCDFVGKPVVFTAVGSVRDWVDKTIAANTDTDPVSGSDTVGALKKESEKQPKAVSGSDIVGALKKGSEKQPKASKLIGLAVEQDRAFAVMGAVRISEKRGLLEELSIAFVEAVESGVDEDVLNPALELTLEVLGD